MQCQEHKPFAGTERFLRMLKMSSTADDHHRHGQWQHSTGKRTCSIRSNFNSQNDCWRSEHEPVNRSFDTEWRTGDEKNLCQDGARESHRTAAGYAVGRTDLLEQEEVDPELMDRIITGDESWFSQYDPETKRQSLEWHSGGSPRPKNIRMSKSKVKCMLVCFFDSMNTVYRQWVPAGQAVSRCYCTGILEILRKKVMRVRPNIAKGWTLHHDNAAAQFLTSKCITVMPQPPHSPDPPHLATSFLFQKVKSAVIGHHFESTEDIQRAVTQALKDIPQAAFQECHKQWQHRWKSCVQA